MTGANGLGIRVALVVLVGLGPVSQAKIVSFQGLGDESGGGFYFRRALGVSADGSVVVGQRGRSREAFRWENGVMTGLGDLPGGVFGGMAMAVSADGSVVVGRGESDSGAEAFRWENGTMVGLGDLTGGAFGSVAMGVSADGSVVVGFGISASGYEAFRWENGTMVGLGDLPGGASHSSAYGVSDDGSIVVGYSTVGSRRNEAFRWENGTMVGLGDLPGGEHGSVAYGVSADGSVIVGSAESASGLLEAFRWENGVMTGLGEGPRGGFDTRAYSVSGDGSVIVGVEGEWAYIADSRSTGRAFIWDADNGMRSLSDVLENDYGLDVVSGWLLGEAVGISADGLTIIGNGINPNGHFEGWVATIPEPGTFLLLALGGLAVGVRRVQAGLSRGHRGLGGGRA